MTRPASFENDERVRLFCALRLPPETVEQLLGWQSEAFAGVQGVRQIPAEQLHVTLAFLGRAGPTRAARLPRDA